MCAENTAIKTKERFQNVDFLRFIFSIDILLYHFYVVFNKILSSQTLDTPTIYQYVFRNFRYGFICVDFFFIISGFFLFKNINKEEDTFNFAINRITRLLPTILFAILVYLIFSLFIDGMNFNFNNNILSVFLLNNIGFSMEHGATSQEWFVAALFWISLFYFYINKIFTRKYLNLIIWVITILSLAFTININYPNFAGNRQISFVIVNHGIVRALGGIGVGYFISMLYNSKFLQNIKTNNLIISILEIYCCSFLIFYRPGNYFLYIVIFSILFYLFIIRKGLLSKLLNNKLSSTIGSYSYSIYIMHIFVYTVLKHSIVLPHPKFVLSHSILFLELTIITSLIVGILTYYFFEKPITKYLKNKFLAKTTNIQ